MSASLCAAETKPEPAFGPLVASLVKNVKQLNSINIYTDSIANQAAQVEILRRMLLSTADDIRALLMSTSAIAWRIKSLSCVEKR
jgi:GTP pyrophosphokinase